MGLTHSVVPVKDLSPEVTPLSKNWITAHCGKTDLSIVEVQRLWDQFRQLGASSVTGRLNMASTSGSRFTPHAYDFLKTIPQTQNQISFFNYCVACQSMEEYSEDEKLRGIFRLFNHGNEWDYSTLRRLVKSLYPRESDEVIRSTADTLLSQFTYGSHDYVTESDFMKYMRNNFDDQVLLDGCLSYKIIPPYLVNRNTTADNVLSSSRNEPRNASDNYLDDARELPSDHQLQNVATVMTEPRRDWRRFLNFLGFTESEIARAEEQNGGGTDSDLMQTMLKKWRDSELGSLSDLRQALIDSNNADVANRYL